MEDIVQNVSITRRPLGITIIAILLFICGIISIIIVIYLLVDRNVRRAFKTGL